MNVPNGRAMPIVEPISDMKIAAHETASTYAKTPLFAPGPARDSATAPMLASSRDQITSKR
jgi:hypothetical protein